VTTVSLLRELERARARLRGLASLAVAPPDPVSLFASAIGPADPWQRDILRSTSRQILMNCCRQSGKSSVAAVLAVHVALHVPGSLILLLSASWRQSQELTRRALEVYAAAGRPVPPDAESRATIELVSGSRIVSLPGRSDVTIRGYSGVGLLIIDEAARVPDELYYAVRPMLAVSGGRLVTLSTPAGQRGWWYEAWQAGGPAWQRVEISATVCPRISPAFLLEERANLPEPVFQAEYQCAFTQTLDQAFRADDVEAAFANTLEPLRLGGAG
jgi:hypothetical protein